MPTQGTERIESLLLESMSRVVGKGAKRAAGRNAAEASQALNDLFSSSDLPGVADPRAVERAAFRIGYTPDERLMVSEWAEKHRVLAGKAASAPGPWRNSKTPYLCEIMDNLSTGSPVWRQSFIAGAQIGKTESGLNWIGYIMSVAPAPTMIIVPKAETAKKISKGRLRPLINATKIVKDRVEEALLLSIEFSGGFVFFASAQSSTDLMSQPAQNLYIDEVDRFPEDCEGEGPPVELALARTRTFGPKKKVFITSTPLEETTSVIWAEFLAGDMRLYHVPCPHCEDMITFEFEGLRWEKGRAKETVHYECPSCKGHIREHHKTRMLAGGEWRPTRQDLENVPEGVRSYRIPSLYAPIGWYSWEEAANDWDAAQGNQTKIDQYRQIVLGLPSVEISEKIDWERVYARGAYGAQPYKMREVPPGVLFLTAGVDVGKDHIEVGVWGWGRNGHRWLIHQYRLAGHIQLPDVWQSLDRALKTTYSNAEGVEFGIVRWLIDTGYVPEIVKPWIRTQNQAVGMGCDGNHHLDRSVQVDTQAEPVRGQPGQKTKHGALLIAQVGVSFLKSELMGQLTIPAPDIPTDVPDNWVHVPLPRGDDEIGFTEEHAKQLVAERKVLVRDNNGRLVKRRWDVVEGRRSEALDCHNYARAAAALYGWERFSVREFQRLEEKVAAAAEEIRAHAAARKRGAAPAQPPAGKVGVRRPAVKSVPDRIAATAGPQPPSTGRVTVSGSRPRVVPRPKPMAEE